MIRIGTAGWDYEDWEGVVYPRPRPRGFDRLAWLARMFDAVEVNVTFYRVPSPATVETWVGRTAGNPRFRFTVKLPRVFTHEVAPHPDADERAFRDALTPLRDAGRLGAVLAQFPQSLHADGAGASRLDAVVDRFADLPLVVEFRHAGWSDPQVGDRLRRRSVGFCNIDQPPMPATLKPSELVTSPVGYVRLHGRNAEEWFRWADRAPAAPSGARPGDTDARTGGGPSEGGMGPEDTGDGTGGPTTVGAGRDDTHDRTGGPATAAAAPPAPGTLRRAFGGSEARGGARRYDYLYTEGELAPWVASIRRMAEHAPDVFVIANNHFRGKAVVNALQIKAALEGTLVEAPGSLVATYPDAMGAIVKRPEGRLPFD